MMLCLIKCVKDVLQRNTIFFISLDTKPFTLSFDMINNKMAVILCHKLEIPHFPHIFFQHGYLTYQCSYMLENYVTYIPSVLFLLNCGRIVFDSL